MAKRGLEALIDKYNKNRDAVTIEDPKPFNAAGAADFSIYRELTTDTIYSEILNALIKNPRNLLTGYKIANTVYRAMLESRAASRNYLEKHLSIDQNNEVYIVKDLSGAGGNIPKDAITPNRFSMILAVAAYQVCDYAMKNKKQSIIDELYKITNPFGMLHGFYPKSKPKITATDDLRMLKYYLCTTIGFDAVIIVNYKMAVAIATYRCYNDHPDKLGLTHGLSSDATVENSRELASRCVQGVYTKEFIYDNQIVKLESIINKSVKNIISEEFKFLIEYGCTPTKARLERARSVAATLLSLADSAKPPKRASV